ncbi:MAG TPA: ABC transporter ATP-binding protein [Treponemataceae bacterium]|nr:ABC transporter ATP-binding protein [Treponemataceae bacterium]
MSNESNTVLQATDISIVFGGLRAVNNFNCKIKESELVGLIGPNGAGKTTVFNMLSGVYIPTEGEINYWDKKNRIHKIGKKTPAVLNKLGISRTFQNIRLFSKLTVEDNIRIALHSSRKIHSWDALLRTKTFRNDEKRMSNKVEQLLSIFDMQDKMYEVASNLPYGQQRKLEICRALASNPQLLLLDEPAAGMNPQETQELMKLIAMTRKQFDVTILLIEHDMNLVMGICERIIVLDYGSVIAKGKPEEIQKNPEVIKAYLGEEALDV